MKREHFDETTELLYCNEANIKCPYCGYEHPDSWEFERDGVKNNSYECDSCGREMWVEMEISVDYTTYRILGGKETKGGAT